MQTQNSVTSPIVAIRTQVSKPEAVGTVRLEIQESEKVKFLAGTITADYWRISFRSDGQNLTFTMRLRLGISSGLTGPGSFRPIETKTMTTQEL